MSSFDETQRQLRIALIAICIIFPIGIIGYMIIEDLSFIEAIWITIITLGTIGYGDIVPETNLGRVFTVFLLAFGLGAVAFVAQAAVVIFVNPYTRQMRLRRKAERKISSLENHYVILGKGELVDRLISYLLKRAELRRIHQREALAAPVDARLERLLGKSQGGLLARIRHLVRQAIVFFMVLQYRGQTLLDVIVVVTEDKEYAQHLQDQHILVVEDDPTDDRILRRAGILNAQAIMCLLENDTETLLSVLTIRSRTQDVYVTAATHDDELNLKLTRVGANNVLVPYELAGQFMNNMTLRPAVNDYFNSIIFDQKASSQLVQLYLGERSPWIGKTIGSLQLRERFETAIIGIRLEDGHYIYAPRDDYVMGEDEVLLAVTPGPHIATLQQLCCRGSVTGSNQTTWQRLPTPHLVRASEYKYSLVEAENAVQKLSKHYIICGSGPVISKALDNLNPERPFVVLSGDPAHISEMRERGFRVIQGDPTHDETLLRAGVDRALAIMVAVEDRADSVLTVLNCRTLNRNLLITVSAPSDDLIPKLRRAGADRVMSPYRIAAQFVLLATTRPAVSDFLRYVLFNYRDGVETTELYMQDDSHWIGHTLEELGLERRYNAGIIGIRQTNGLFIYAPPASYVMKPHEVIIVIATMGASDELRVAAHGGESRRPRSLRR